jgi:hypothetical protein
MFLKNKQSFWSNEEKWNALSHGIGGIDYSLPPTSKPHHLMVEPKKQRQYRIGAV